MEIKNMIIERLRRPEKKAIVISVNSSKAMTVSNYSKVAKMVKNQTKLNNTNLPKIKESIKKTKFNTGHRNSEENIGTFNLEEGSIKPSTSAGTAVKFNFMRNHQLEE